MIPDKKLYAIRLHYSRPSQNLSGEEWTSLELADGFTVDDIKMKLANDYFCCQLTIIEVKPVMP